MESAIERGLIRSRSVALNAQTRALSLKEVGALSLDLGMADGSGQFAGHREQAANRQKYAMYRGWVYAAVHALASRAATQPVHIGRMVDKGKGNPQKLYAPHARARMTQNLRERSADSELEIYSNHKLLHTLEKPNPIQHRFQFVYSFVANLCMTGWGYVLAGKNDDGKIEFYSVPSTWVTPVHKTGPFSHFRVGNPKGPSGSGDGSELLDRSQVAFAHLPNPSDPLSALAPAQSQMQAIRVDDNIQSSQVAFFQNGIFPSAIVTMGKYPHPDVQGGVRPRLTGAQRRQVYSAIRKVMSGIANYGTPAIVDGMVESIERLSMTQNELGWQNSEKAIRTRILSAFGVHPFILGEEMVGSYAQAYIVESRFYDRVNIFLDMLGVLMTSFVADIEQEEKPKPKPKLKARIKPDKPEEEKSETLVWWVECRAVDPGIEKSLWENARSRDDVSQNEFRAFMDLPPDADRNEASINKTSLQAVAGIAGQVTAEKLTPEQGVALLRGLGLPDKLAKSIAGTGPSEEMKKQRAEQQAQQQAQLEAQQQAQNGGEPPPENGKKPPPGDGQKPNESGQNAKPGGKPPKKPVGTPKDDEEKDLDLAIGQLKTVAEILNKSKGLLHVD